MMEKGGKTKDSSKLEFSSSERGEGFRFLDRYIDSCITFCIQFSLYLSFVYGIPPQDLPPVDIPIHLGVGWRGGAVSKIYRTVPYCTVL